MAEHRIVQKVITRLNDSHGKHRGVRFDLLNYRNAVLPGPGEDPQAVVNNAIGDDYDIYLGFLWTRFGTPTPRAESGTAEEFYWAYRRWQQEPDSVGVMMYFSDAKIKPSLIDVDQLAKVRAFRELIQAKNLYFQYTGLKDLDAYLDKHLAHYLYQPPKIRKRSGRSSRVVFQGTLKQPQVPFIYGQDADFHHFRLQRKTTTLQIEITIPTAPYWRAGFALAPEEYVQPGRKNVLIQQHFLFHIGRGTSANRTERTRLHYQAYYEDRALTHQMHFDAESPIILNINIEHGAHPRVRIDFADITYEASVNTADLQHGYLLAWADMFPPFAVPMILRM